MAGCEFSDGWPTLEWPLEATQEKERVSESESERKRDLLTCRGSNSNSNSDWSVAVG